MSRRGCTRRLFFCKKNGKEDLCYGTQNHAKATDKNHIHLQISQQILLGKFAEPKRRYLAQNCYFDAKVEPLWLNNEIYPNRKRSGFHQRKTGEGSRCSYALRGMSHCITSRDFVCHRSPNHSRNRLPLWGRSPQSPERRDVYGERYSYCSPGDGKGERENPVQSPKMRAEYD